MLYELKLNKFKFTRVADFDKNQNKFFNFKVENNEFNVEKLIFSNNFDMYLSHLEKLDLIRVTDRQSKPIFKDEKNTEQIGIRETYTIGLTQFGELFVKACLPDN